MKDNEQAIYKPNHENSNINGMVNPDGSFTCITRKGALCSGCCFVHGIKEIYHLSNEQGFIVETKEFTKPQLTECEYSTPQQGCKIKNTPLCPDMCNTYSCRTHLLNVITDPNRTDEDRNRAYITSLAILDRAVKVGETEAKHADEMINKLRSWLER